MQLMRRHKNFATALPGAGGPSAPPNLSTFFTSGDRAISPNIPTCGLRYIDRRSEIGGGRPMDWRQCGEAKNGQVVVDRKVLAALGKLPDSESLGELTLKGFHRPIAAYNVRGLRAS